MYYTAVVAYTVGLERKPLPIDDSPRGIKIPGKTTFFLYRGKFQDEKRFIFLYDEKCNEYLGKT